MAHRHLSKSRRSEEQMARIRREANVSPVSDVANRTASTIRRCILGSYPSADWKRSRWNGCGQSAPRMRNLTTWRTNREIRCAQADRPDPFASCAPLGVLRCLISMHVTPQIIRSDNHSDFMYRAILHWIIDGRINAAHIAPEEALAGWR